MENRRFSFSLLLTTLCLENKIGEMKALVLEKGDFKVKNIPAPSPQKDEALIKVLKTGICNTDLDLAKGYMGYEGILGHEFVGRVVEAMDANWLGKRVVGEINIPCRECEFCLGGMAEHCLKRSVLGISQKNGAFAEFLTLPLANLHSLPTSVSDIEAVFIEPLAASLEIFEQIKIESSDSILVLGDGKLGLLIAQVMKLKTEMVSCLGKYKRKLKILNEKHIETFLLQDKIEKRFDVVVEATGNKEGLDEALFYVKPRGKIVLKSTFQGKAEVNISKLVVDEVHLIGSRCGPFLKAINALEKKKVDVKKIVDGDFPLEKGVDAFTVAQKPGVMKILITP